MSTGKTKEAAFCYKLLGDTSASSLVMSLVSRKLLQLTVTRTLVCYFELCWWNSSQGIKVRPDHGPAHHFSRTFKLIIFLKEGGHPYTQNRFATTQTAGNAGKDLELLEYLSCNRKPILPYDRLIEPQSALDLLLIAVVKIEPSDC
jgi:hypothetical protein